MGAFKIIHDVMWDSKNFKKLTKDNKHAHFCGMYRLPVAYIANDLGDTINAIAKGLQCLSDGYFLEYDNDEEVVWVKEMLREQTNDLKFSAKQLQGIINKLIELQESVELIQSFKSYYFEIEYGDFLDKI